MNVVDFLTIHKLIEYIYTKKLRNKEKFNAM